MGKKTNENVTVSDSAMSYWLRHEFKDYKGYEKPDPFDRDLFVADFETTVDEDTENQQETEVWSAALCPVFKNRTPEPEDVIVYDNIYEFIDKLSGLPDNSIVFFHNLRFDGSFILDELNEEGFLPCMSNNNFEHYASNKELLDYENVYKVCISNLGQWYSLTIRFSDRTIEIWDSSKKIPSDLRSIGKNFATKYQKLDMKYEGKRHKFGRITDEEMDYIKNDVLVLSEAISIVWYQYEMTHMTIAGDALESYKSIIGEDQFKLWFPDLTSFVLPIELKTLEEYKAFFTNTNLKEEDILKELPYKPTVYDYCLRGYSGGWCYKNEYAKNKVFLSDENFKYMIKDEKYVPVKNVLVLDVNSLYPSVMHSMSGCEYPVGDPEYHKGEPNKYEEKMFCIYRRFRCRFNINEGYLPFIHIRGKRGWYDANMCLKTSDVFGERYVNGEDTVREYVMTQVEFDLFKEHYNITEYEPLDYIAFDKQAGIFDKYIDKYIQMKIQASKEKNKAKRTIAKLFLNSLYGKLSSSTNSSYKTVSFEEGTLKFHTHIEYCKDPISISAGAYITANARNFTIRAAQKSYFEDEDRGFMYADTDSLHIVDMFADEVEGVTIDPNNLCCWKAEVSRAAVATYAKQKTYIEVATEEDFEKVLDKDGKESYNIIMKAAGLSDNGKNKFQQALLNPTDPTKLNDFKPGLKIAKCNLKAKQIKGGVLLEKCDFKLS